MDSNSYVVIDTNILLRDSSILEGFKKIIMPSAVLEELDGLKNSKEIGFMAREANRKIEEYKDVIEFENKDLYDNIPNGWDKDKRDNKIVLCARDHNAVLISNDINVRIKADSLGIECCGTDESLSCDDVYKGYKDLSGDTNYINKLFGDIEDGINTYGFVINEYLILKNTDLKKVNEFRFDGVKFVELKLPPSRVLKGLNSEQRCLLDLLNNKNIGIHGVLGCFGSGKTFLSLRMALYHVQEKGTYSKILAVREPVSEGTQIGFLKGTFSEKTEHFFKPIQQCLNGGEFEMSALLANGVLEKSIPYYLKGTTYDETLIVVDEAEDLTKKQLQMIGTRLGKNSAITFCGDYKQAIKDANNNNPLVKMCNKLKGNPNFGCIILPEDVRSPISKVFAELWDYKDNI